jgi:glycyl-tRNA synthetase beta chain
MSAALLLELGCEEIPARFLPAAARDLATRAVALLDQAGLDHGPTSAWGGSRRLAIRIEGVAERQRDREEEVLGPPAKAAFLDGGALSAAAIGFARKQGIDPSELRSIETAKGVYVGYRRSVGGRALGEILADSLPAAVEAMSFPKSMRWGDGRFRWVRPVHWILALHGNVVLPIELFGVKASGRSRGHRFLSPGVMSVPHADDYEKVLLGAFVLVDPGQRRRALKERLEDAARGAGGELVEDSELLDEAADLVEWPGVVIGRFDPGFLGLPREVLLTTLRHHQKAFSVQAGGNLMPVFLAVANTDRDPAGHVRRGNEWVVDGRLEDARFFWIEDRKTTLDQHLGELSRVVFHRKSGSYADKAARLGRLAETLARKIGLNDAEVSAASRAAVLCKADLVTGLVGEFPELQGVAGGLLLRAEGADERVADAVYEHYKPAGPEDTVPATVLGSVVSVADKLDTVSELLAGGESPTGSRDPFGLRRATNAIFRIVTGSGWSLSLRDMVTLTGTTATASVIEFLVERFQDFLRDAGASPNEIQAIARPKIGLSEFESWPLGDVLRRLDAVKTVRRRDDFARLVELTKRVDNILTQGAAYVGAAEGAAVEPSHVEVEEAAIGLSRLLDERDVVITSAAEARDYASVIDLLASFVSPVARFFDEVLVLDTEKIPRTRARLALLSRLRTVLTRYFDIRELAGQADRRA